MALAGILAMHPKILIFDEPFTHLDYQGGPHERTFGSRWKPGHGGCGIHPWRRRGLCRLQRVQPPQVRMGTGRFPNPRSH
ncbi:MAG: hypothetical protein SWC40_08990 [Thermodesulfobacteriota bacterium]|nr:hypothetical protein [Thermodesulfobacteriota bacterium]